MAKRSDMTPVARACPAGQARVRYRRVTTRGFFAVDAACLAVKLIGALLVRRTPDGMRLAGRIVETEAYLGVQDRASHASGGRRTPRNESMYARPGTAYVYFTYGMHHCFNIVCGQEGEPAAVLVRALEPVGWPWPSPGVVVSGQAQENGLADGLEVVESARSRLTKLLSGPGKLCRAMGLDRSMDGADLVRRGGAIWLELPTQPCAPPRLARSPRVGLGACGVWAGRLLRWYEAENPSVSGGRRGGRPRARGTARENG
ncbi:MAG: DNA-3-methyladenine glycosylase [Phycisphaeraceae bacterium]|nr:DNA-3-methyladenine glycosylase [Phycisphaeraceae bacterium]